MSSSNITTSQTIGPFPHEGWRWGQEVTQVAPGGHTVVVHGAMLDGQGQPVDDGWVEAWTPDAAAAESGLPVPGFRRAATDDKGAFRFELSLPGAPRAGQPLAWITIFARGLLKHQFSALFLEDDGGLDGSPLLGQVDPARRDTLIARKQPDGSYRWDIHLQGERETVFLDFS